MNKLYTNRHALWRKAFYPQSLVPERNDNYQIKNIWTPKEAEDLLQMLKDKKVFGYGGLEQTDISEHMGEAVPINPDGSCSHHLLIPNKDRTLCVLA